MKLIRILKLINSYPNDCLHVLRPCEDFLSYFATRRDDLIVISSTGCTEIIYDHVGMCGESLSSLEKSKCQLLIDAHTTVEVS